jgi:hypothetical protein
MPANGKRSEPHRGRCWSAGSHRCLPSKRSDESLLRLKARKLWRPSVIFSSAAAAGCAGRRAAEAGRRREMGLAASGHLRSVSARVPSLCVPSMRSVARFGSAGGIRPSELEPGAAPSPDGGSGRTGDAYRPRLCARITLAHAKAASRGRREAPCPRGRAGGDSPACVADGAVAATDVFGGHSLNLRRRWRGPGPQKRARLVSGGARVKSRRLFMGANHLVDIINSMRHSARRAVGPEGGAASAMALRCRAEQSRARWASGGEACSTADDKPGAGTGRLALMRGTTRRRPGVRVSWGGHVM